ncbi:protein WVD2-like 7 isoform X3 [Juglans regia]|uniref:Protein WVD2-like 7 isoform X3 n=1 Tax=Juglans regia TaxID=51240 RepID=A0A6P9ELC1_JUGRE|nr:protein WVD2-like 7 isoform X3 [Juglans regia]
MATDSDARTVSISDILDHGSISFGRFAVESLAWEKRSVFSHNRCQEELEKFKAPGFVAQKKAYFEEYYGRVRAMAALQVKQQQTTHPDSTSSTTQEENAVDADLMKGEKMRTNVTKMQKLGNETAANLNSSEGGIVEGLKEINQEELSCHVEDSDKANMTGGTSKSLSTIEPEDSVKGAYSSSVNKSSGTAKHDFPVHDTAKHDANKQNKQATIQKATDSSRENEMHLDCKITKGAVKPSEKLKPSLHHDITSKRDDGLVSAKGTPQPAKVNNYVSSHKQRAEVRSIATALHNSLAREMSVKSPVCNAGQVKANSTSKVLLEKLPTKLPLHARSTKVHYLSYIHIGFSTRSSTDGLPCWSWAPIYMQGITEESAITDHLTKRALHGRRRCDGDGRKTLEPSVSQMRPKRGASKNQRSNVMFTNHPIQSNLNQDCGVEFGHKTYVQGPQKKGEDKRNTGLGKVFKSASTNLSSTNNAPNPKLVPKVGLSRPVELRHTRREPRPKMPSWR